MAKPEKTNPFDYNELINEFIQKIDNEKSLFKFTDEFHGYGMTFYIVGLFLFLAGIVSYLPDSIAPFIGRMTLLIAIAALLLTFISFTSKGRENNVVDANFGKTIKKFKIEKREEEKRLLLEALLKMKALNRTYKLATVKGIHPEMFTKEKLLEKLYE